MNKILLFLFLLIATSPAFSQSRHKFTLGKQEFLLDALRRIRGNLAAGDGGHPSPPAENP